MSTDPDRVVRRVAACAQTVGLRLHPGLEIEDYETALDQSMRAQKLQFARQYPFGMPFDGPPDRGFRADFIVEGDVLLELVHVQALSAAETQLALGYLRESGADLCLLINFGRAPVEMRRIQPSGDWSVEIG